MAAELSPSWPEMQELVATLVANCEEGWPGRKFEHLCTVTSAELDLVCVFVQVDSLKQLALEVARG